VESKLNLYPSIVLNSRFSLFVAHTVNCKVCLFVLIVFGLGLGVME
jgi:hypothetical protein